MAIPVHSSRSRICKYQAICKRKPASDNMVQTKSGSRNNPWLEHLRQCAAEYQRHRAAEHASSEEQSATGTASDEKPVRRRVVGKKAIAPPKAEVKLLEGTNKPTVKVQGKQKAKKVADNS